MIYKKINYEYIFPAYFDVHTYDRRKDFFKGDIKKHLLLEAHNVIESESTNEFKLFIGKVTFDNFSMERIDAHIEIIRVDVK